MYYYLVSHAGILTLPAWLSAVLSISVFSIVGYKPMLNVSIIASMPTYLYAPMPTTYVYVPIVQGVGHVAIAINAMHELY